jgi:RimJ/RimL family protein N-acetyltransferase
MQVNVHAIKKELVWLNDPETTKYLEAADKKWDEPNWRDWYKKQCEKGRIVYWIIKDDVVGTLTIGPIDHTHLSAPIGLMIGEGRGRGVGTEAIKEAVGLCFGKLNLHRVWCGVLSENTASIRAFEKAGFVQEGILRQSRRRGTEWADEIRMGLVREV